MAASNSALLTQANSLSGTLTTEFGDIAAGLGLDKSQATLDVLKTNIETFVKDNQNIILEDLGKKG